jgi:DHA2 family multidrug resistance protein-like MFS transporter
MIREELPTAGRREWIGLAVLALPCLLYSMDLTVLNLALPAIATDLQPTSTQLLWIVDIYGFLVAGSLITMGTLGDRIGRRRLLLIGAGAFGLASVLAAFASSAPMLIGARAILGVAGATLAPSTLSLIRNMFLDPRQRTFAIGVWATSYSVGAAIGPVLGGLTLDRFWWGSVFLLGVPVMLLLLALGPWLLPESRDPRAGRPDIPSAALSMAAVLAVIFSLKRVAEEGPGPLAGFVMLAGIGAGLMFIRRQQTLADPLVDLSLFRAPGFSAALAINLLSIFVAFGPFVLIAQYLQLVLGLTPLQAGLWIVPSAIGNVVGSMVAPMLVRWMKPASVITAGLGIAAVGLIVLSQATPESGLLAMVVGSVILALGLTPPIIISTDMIVSAAPPERAGAAAALSETGAELGGALGIAILGTIGTAIYRGAITTTVPAAVPEAEALAARQTLGGALAAGHQLPQEIGDTLIMVAREAFSETMEITALISAVMLFATAIFAAVALRNVASAQEARSD